MEEGEVPPWSVDEVEKQNREKQVEEFLERQGLKGESVPGSSKAPPTDGLEKATDDDKNTVYEEPSAESGDVLKIYKVLFWDLIETFSRRNSLRKENI